MASISEPSRNQTGLAALRRRYVARARHLAAQRSGPFLRDIEAARRLWNQAFPQFEVIRGDLDVAWELPSTNQIDGLLLPARMNQAPRHEAELAEALATWRETVETVRSRYLGDRWFQNPWLSQMLHPANAFVSASILFDPRLLSDDQIEQLLPSFIVEPKSIPYSIDQYLDPFHAAVLRARLTSYAEAIAELLPEQPEQLNQILINAAVVSWERAEEQFPEGPTPQDPRLWQWHIPVLAGLSANDIVDAAPSIAELSLSLATERTVNNMIRELAAEGMKRTKIAELLGVVSSTVTRALAEGSDAEDGLADANDP